MNKMNLIDADAFIEEMSDRIENAIKWKVNAQNDVIKLRAEQAIATFCEVSLTAMGMPTVEAIPIEFIKEYIEYQDPEEKEVLRMMLHAWELVEKEKEAKI